ncbi:hypothetical protein ABID22_003605 [Pontibacter aydingkolensis]|uniref:Uncharacterized protein n=1 Tax=Pontibacter aydingkolensis TaxID=1911536 RepID=A0ABS7CYL8_9BACT|nr:hypothetical protein [Pontibacter aydingkolensis]MBW7468939.1 hypothetical protein [Pontibacter aydingkolensis]
MKKKQTSTFPLFLIATTLLLVGAVTYLYISTHLEEEDVDFDLYDEDTEDYY